MLTPCILLSCLLSSTADNSKLVIFFQSLLDPNSCLHSFSLYRAITILLPDSVLPDDFRHWPIQLSINIGPFGKSVVLVLFFLQFYMFTLATHRFMHNCIRTVLLVIWLFCSLYGYSATLAAKLIIKLDLTWCLEHLDG